MEFIKLNKSSSPVFTLNNISFYKMDTYVEPELEPTPTVVYTLSSDGTYYIVGDGSSTAGNGLTADNTETEIVIASTYNGLPVKEIGTYAFRDCTSLTSVIIPNSVISIGTNAFMNCTSLTSITIPSGVTSIGGGAFTGCTSLTSMTIPEGVTSIGTGVFQGCTNLTSIIIPSSITSIGGGAFIGCDALVGTEYDNGIYLGNSQNLYLYLHKAKSTDITSATINSQTKIIGSNAFMDCSGLTSVIIPSSVTSISPNAFMDCSGLTSITIPNGVTSIGSSAFNGCSGLTIIDLSGATRLESIDSSAFASCTSLASITIPEGVTSIGGSAFGNCTSLTSVIIPSSVTSIGTAAFKTSNTLKTLTFEHTAENSLSLPTSGSVLGFLYSKTARNVTVYHRNNPIVLGYDYTGDNVTPTFVELTD